MNSMLQDVIRHGTATKALELKRSDIAGKTGTTNEQRDAWFNGYSPGLVAVSWLGFDSPKPLGEGETGGHAALPMWINFMKEALKDIPESSFSLPDGLLEARVSPSNGLLVKGKNAEGEAEYYPPDQMPKRFAAPAKKKSKKPANHGGSDEDAAPGDSGGSDEGSDYSPPSHEGGGKSVEPLF